MMFRIKFHNVATFVAALSLMTADTQAALHGRRKLSPSNSIGQEMRNEHAKGNSHPRFTLVGEVPGSGGLDFAVDVVEPTPAVTEETTFSEMNGPREKVGESDFTILVADTENKDGTVAIISVNKNTDEVNGIVQKKGGKPMKFTQARGNKATATEAAEFTPPDWACGVSDEEEAAGRRSLFAEEHGQLDHQDHQDHHDHHHHHDHKIGKSVEDALDHVREGLRGSSLKIGKRRKLQGGAAYNYQVDVYVEIDQTLVNDNQGIFNPNTIEYVNSIFTGANTIYEDEIDTHLNVLHIDLNDNYDGQSSTSNALTQMRNIYSGLGFNYYPGIDLHHALLSRNLGGGIAYLGVICNTAYGFGLSASLSGNFRSMDNAVVWDMMVFMHEIGHNFNSGHTHSGYSPSIDTCGCTKDNTCSEACPAALPLAKSSTIMSYCHLCSGGYSNMDYTFGGDWNGSGSRSDVNNYVDAVLAGDYNVDPRRVPHKMYSHVSTRSCTDIPGTPSPTEGPTSKPTNAPSSLPTANPTMPTDSPTPAPTMAPTMKPTSKPTDSPIPAPSGSPTMRPSMSPTAPTSNPTKSPSIAPTVPVDCGDPTITQAECIAASNCRWRNKKGGTCEFLDGGDGGGGGGGGCLAKGTACPADANECCSKACTARGRKLVCA